MWEWAEWVPHPEKLDSGLSWRGRWALGIAGWDARTRRGILRWKPEKRHLSLLSVKSGKGLLEVLWLPTPPAPPLLLSAPGSRLLLYMGFPPASSASFICLLSVLTSPSLTLIRKAGAGPVLREKLALSGRVRWRGNLLKSMRVTQVLVTHPNPSTSPSGPAWPGYPGDVEVGERVYASLPVPCTLFPWAWICFSMSPFLIRAPAPLLDLLGGMRALPW